jgi:hypothetical protein
MWGDGAHGQLGFLPTAVFSKGLEGSETQCTVDRSVMPPAVRYQGQSYKVEWIGERSTVASTALTMFFKSVDANVRGKVELSDGSQFENPGLPYSHHAHHESFAEPRLVPFFKVRHLTLCSHSNSPRSPALCAFCCNRTKHAFRSHWGIVLVSRWVDRVSCMAGV